LSRERSPGVMASRISRRIMIRSGYGGRFDQTGEKSGGKVPATRIATQ
jgi:hypothetical protein